MFIGAFPGFIWHTHIQSELSDLAVNEVIAQSSSLSN
jgi:hypothetical protein